MNAAKIEAEIARALRNGQDTLAQELIALRDRMVLPPRHSASPPAPPAQKPR